jgi:hypothetical protein
MGPTRARATPTSAPGTSAPPDPPTPRTPNGPGHRGPGPFACRWSYCGCWVVSSNVWYSSVVYAPASTSTSSPPASVSVPTGTW